MRVVIVAVALALSAACTDPLFEGPREPLARGKELYNSCMPCHGKDGLGVTVAAAPEIAGLPEWYIEAQVMKFRAGKRGYHFDDLAGLRMRPMSLSMPTEADVKDVALFISTLPRSAHAVTIQGGNVEHGKQLFNTCQACHGADAAGNQVLNAPMLAGADDWYLLAQLNKFKLKVRGDAAIDPVGGTMQAMSAVLPDEQAEKDVVAYIKTLPTPTPKPAAPAPKG
ncbi:MAG TPA: c-type cytochrome [Myxococcota bacterium]